MLLGELTGKGAALELGESWSEDMALGSLILGYSGIASREACRREDVACS